MSLYNVCVSSFIRKYRKKEMMRKILLVFVGVYVASILTGCVAVKENQYSINQLKTQVMNVENALARHNLMLQQNKAEIDSLYDINEQVSYTPPAQSKTIIASTQSVLPKIVKINNFKYSILSNKLNETVTIYDVQTGLKNSGFYLGKIDGKPGPLTKESIKRFQRSNSLNDDGVIGNQTWAKLKRYL